MSNIVCLCFSKSSIISQDKKTKTLGWEKPEEGDDPISISRLCLFIVTILIKVVSTFLPRFGAQVPVDCSSLSSSGTCLRTGVQA